MTTKKAGCILINLETKKIALVNRKNEYSFPKGHLEVGKTWKEIKDKVENVIKNER